MAGLGSSPEFKKEVFKLSAENALALHVFDIGGKQVLAVFKERLLPEDKEFDDKKASYVAQIEGRRRNDAVNAFIDQLKKKSKIEMSSSFTDLAAPS